MPTRIMCVEWEKRNQHLAAERSEKVLDGELGERRAASESSSVPSRSPDAGPPRPAAAPQTAPSAASLLAMPPSSETRREPNVTPDGLLKLTPPEPKAGRAADAARRAFAATFPEATAVVLDAPPFVPAKEIDPASLEALEATGAELTFGLDPSVSSEPIFLVPRRTEKSGERFEMTFREAATLRLIMDAFPGARLVKLVRGEPPEKVCPRCLGIKPGEMAPEAEDVPFGVRFCGPCEEVCARMTPDGFVNNCALRHGESEATCQMCRGACPDKHRLMKLGLVPTMVPPTKGAQGSGRSPVESAQSKGGTSSSGSSEPDPFEV